MALDAKGFAIAIGAMTGGMISDDEGYGTITGLAIGGLVGANWKNVKTNHKFIEKEKVLVFDNVVPKTKREELVEQINELVAKKDLTKFLSQDDIDIDFFDLKNTLTIHNIQTAISDGNETHLTSILDILKTDNRLELLNSSYFKGLVLEDLDRRGLKSSVGIVTGQDVQAKITALRSILEAAGYEDEELEKKVKLFSSEFADGSKFEFDSKLGKLTLESGKFNITQKMDLNNGSTFKFRSDGHSVYSVRNLNPFSSLLADAPIDKVTGNIEVDVDKVITALGANEASATYLRENWQKVLTSGFAPEDLKFILSNSKNFVGSPEDLDSFIGTSEVFRPGESSIIRAGSGNIREYESQLLDSTKDISNTTNLKKTLDLKPNLDPDKPVGLTTTDSQVGRKASTLAKARQKLLEWSGLKTLTSGVKADHSHLVNLTGKDRLNFNRMSDAARNVGMDASRDYRLHIDTSRNTLLEAFAQLRDSGSLGEGVQTAVIMRRLSEDEEVLNEVLSKNESRVGTVAFADGTGIVDSSYMRNVHHEFRDRINIDLDSTINTRIKEILDLREKYDVTADSQKVYFSTKRVDRWREGLPRVFEKSFKKLGFKDTDFSKVLEVIDTDKLAFMHEGKELAYGPGLIAEIEANLDKFKISPEKWEKAKVLSEVSPKFNSTMFNLAGRVNAYLDTEEANLRETLNVLKSLKNDPKLKDSYKILQDGLKRKDFRLTSEELETVTNTLRERNNAINGYLSSEEILGRSSKGQDYTISKIMNRPRLLSVSASSNQLSLVIGDESNLAREGETLKFFGAASKANLKKVDSNVHSLIAENVMKDLYKDYKLPGKLINALSEHVNAITESGTSGQGNTFKAIRHLMESTKNWKDLSTKEIKEVVSKSVNQLMLNDVEGKQIFKKDSYNKKVLSFVDNHLNEILLDPKLQPIEKANKLWGTFQAVNALHKGKNTNAVIVGMQTGLLARVKEISAKPELTTHDKKFIKDVFGKDYLKDYKHDSKGYKKLERDVIKKAQQVKNLYSSDDVIKNTATGKMLTKEVLSMYQHAYDTFGVDYAVSSPSTHSTFNTGAGNNIGMSHFSAGELVKGGFDPELLGMFVYQNDKVKYDLAAFQATASTSGNNVAVKIGNHVEYKNTLNAFMDEAFGNNLNKHRAFINEIRDVNPEHLKSYLKVVHNVSDDILNQDFIHYTVQGSDYGTNIRTIPLYTANTNRGGFTKGSDNRMFGSKLFNRQFDVILADIQASSETATMTDKEAYKKSLLDMTKHYLDGFASENNPLAKEIFSYDSNNGFYLKATPINKKEFVDLYHKEYKEGRSIIAISPERAKTILRNQNIDVSSKDFKLSDYLTEDGRLAVDTDKDKAQRKPQMSINTREPAVSDRSSRVVTMYVQEGMNDKEIGVYFQDMHYSKLMYGDFDDDHVALISASRQLNNEEYDKLLSYSQKKAKYRNNAIEVAKALNVKAKGSSEAKSAFTIIDELMETHEQYGLTESQVRKLTPQAREVVDKLLWESWERDTANRAKRKTSSPAITTLTTTISEHIMENVRKFGLGEATEQSLEFARVITHSTVEQLIKAAHAGGSAGRDPLGELLSSFSAYKRGSKSMKDPQLKKDYITRLTGFFDNLTEDLLSDMKAKGNTAMYDDIKKALDLIISSEDKATFSEPSNVLQFNTATRKQHRSLMETIKGLSLAENSDIGIQKALEHLAGVAEKQQALSVQERKINISKSVQASGESIGEIVSTHIKANKMPLGIGAAVLAVNALFTQDDPNFYPKGVTAGEVSNMTLAPQIGLADESAMFDSLKNTPTAHILPEFDVNSFKNTAMEAYGGYSNAEAEFTGNINEAIFGNNLSNVRINTRHDYY